MNDCLLSGCVVIITFVYNLFPAYILHNVWFIVGIF